MKVVENAIIVPIFTMIIIALISVGIYMHDRIIIRNMVSQISIEYEKESDITARKELIKRGERYAADRTMFLRDINIYDDRVYEQDESIVCSASFPVSLIKACLYTRILKLYYKLVNCHIICKFYIS